MTLPRLLWIAVPGVFFAAAGALYLAISSTSGWTLKRAEGHLARGLRRA